MSMTRRNFLKLLGLTVAAAMLPIGQKKEYPDFNPSTQYGDYVIITDDSPEMVREARRHLFNQIKDIIPPEYRDQISWINMPFDDPLSQRGSVGWKYTPKRSVA